MEFRRLTLKDLDAAYSNRLRALVSDPDAFLTTLDEEKARGSEHFKNVLSRTDDDGVIFGAVQDGRVVGTLGVYIDGKFKLRHKAVIWGVHVDAEFRGQGIARRLLDLAITHARDHLKARVIYLAVAATNPGARALYESRGFQQWGLEPRAVFDGDQLTDEVHMSLLL